MSKGSLDPKIRFLGQKQVDKNRMGPIWVAHIVTQMGPMWGHVFGLTGFISKSLSKLNEDSSL